MKSIIAWFVKNPVAANLFMLILIVGGLLMLPNIYQEEFPNVNTNVIQVTVPYLGAAPIEVEEGVCVRIEEAITGTPGIDTISSSAAEGLCVVSAKLQASADKAKALNDIKSRVDAIDSFPAETEQPVVSELTIIANVLQIVVSGDADERTLKHLGEKIRDDLVELPGVSQVKVNYVRPYEIAIEISEQNLRRFGLTIDQVARAIRQSSLNLPGGNIKTADGEILLRTNAQAYSGWQFEQLVILTRTDGTSVTLAEIATVIDGFEDSDMRAHFDGHPAIIVEVRRVGEEDVLAIADQVKNYIKQAQEKVPAGIRLTIWKDESQDLVDRLDALSSNAWSGLFLVVLVLALFLKFRIALWVAAGIPIALLGTVLLFPAFDISISTLSVMAFLLALGILVDDAIVVGERIHAHEQLGSSPVQAAIDGTHEVSVPVIFGVLTTMVTFTPIMFIPATMGPFFAVIGATVILALAFSLMESQLILPAHLAHRKQTTLPVFRSTACHWERFQSRLSNALEYIAFEVYQPLLLQAFKWRYLCAACAIAVIVLTISMMASGRIIFQFFPSVPGERLYANITLPEGSVVEATEKAVKQLEAAARKLQTELDGGPTPAAGESSRVKHIMSSIGAQLAKSSIEFNEQSGSHFAEVCIELDLPADYQGPSPDSIANRWRKLTGDIADAVELTFSADSFSAGKPIEIQLRGPDFDQLKQAANRVREHLLRYEGVYDLSDSFRGGKQELQLSLLPGARHLGLSTEDLGRQVRQAFYGEEVQRIQRGKDDVRVMLRFPESQRRSLGDLEDMRIRTSDGIEVPFASVTKLELGKGFSTIKREDGQRIIRVMANVNRDITSPEEVLSSLQQHVLDDIHREFPGIDYGLAGEAGERADALAGIIHTAMLALFVIYALLAIPLHSYLQPLVIMSAIPFGAIGAILGHYLLGYDLVFFSIIGIVALSGVVVNSSLVMVDYINRKRAAGGDLHTAVGLAGAVRFRPIVLTSMTTFVGLAPLMATSSLATMMFVPLAVSLAFGVLFATSITLFLIPCLYLMLEDWHCWRHAFYTRLTGSAETLEKPQS
jgi:multidrug efflux pump subunit AcrB